MMLRFLRRKLPSSNKLLLLGLAVTLLVFQFAEYNPISRLKSAGIGSWLVQDEQETNAFESKKDDVPARQPNQSSDFKDNLHWNEKEQGFRLSGVNHSSEQSTQSLNYTGKPPPTSSVRVNPPNVGISTRNLNTGSKKRFAGSAGLTELKDVFISVKTTSAYHRTRVTDLLHTWVHLAKSQVYFFTDSDDKNLKLILGRNIINTGCDKGHGRNALCCKMQSELEFFLQKFQRRWFCHFDDDNYVNIPALLRTLRWYRHTEDVYLGKLSYRKKVQPNKRSQGNQKFRFATGGAGFCISKALMMRMDKHVSHGKFVETCERTALPDDCTVGFISDVLLKTKLTKLSLFHSHLEDLSLLKPHQLHDQISFSHSDYLHKKYNRIRIQGAFDEKEDPSRFKSIHCFLNPSVSWCPPNKAA